ncbi:sensor histidine kinase [Leptospira idonii]|uniref:histidine kinase n=1 Tax=Leptospira idonii TaxID=1193500 RepID=A0A4R9M055_9LEPT|nr:HAMP domain-containing sensor histidine kinase [Leptospira idonii]TGN20030.1 sensor histidine kinase [Leptospira idonii]
MIFSLAWLSLTISLGIWWWVLGMRQAKTISEISKTSESRLELERMNRMLKLEGSFFLTMLAGGGITLAFLSYRDHKRSKLISDFFSTVTHEMKTPLASLQLQIEGLIDDNPNLPITKRLEKLLKENKRIESRMAKAFYLASLMQGEPLYLETFQAEELFEHLKMDFPNLQMEIQSESKRPIRGDKRALESILKNLVENAVLHGKATQITIQSLNANTNKAHIQVTDNGTGFQGEWSQLGEPFLRHTVTSGTGIGLYIAKKLMEKMKGKLILKPLDTGFMATLELPSLS